MSAAQGLPTADERPPQSTTQEYTITRRQNSTEVSPDEIGSSDLEISTGKADDKGTDSHHQPSKPSPSKPTGSRSSFTPPSHRASQLKESKDETTTTTATTTATPTTATAAITTPGKIPLSPSGMALSSLLSGTSG